MSSLCSISVDSESHTITDADIDTYSVSSMSSMETVPVNVASNKHNAHCSSYESKEDRQAYPIQMPVQSAGNQRLFSDHHLPIWKYKRESRTYSTDGDIDESIRPQSRKDTPRNQLSCSSRPSFNQLEDITTRIDHKLDKK